MKIAILSIGDELLQGNVINTNAAFFSKELHTLGYDTDIHLTLKDDFNSIKEGILLLHQKYDLIIVSGGLGPTSDDVTKESIASALNIELRVNEKELFKLQEWFKNNNITYEDVNTKQAMFSDLDTIVLNKNGTANGYYFTKDDTTYWVLPGPPSENRVMFKNYLNTLNKQELFEDNLYIINLGESSAEAMMHHLYQKYPTIKIGTYIQDYGIIYRLISLNQKINKQCLNELKDIFKDYYVCESSDPLKELVNYLIDNKLTISTAESLTAGMCVALIANIPNSSTILKESIITYSNETKIKYLKVSEETLNKYSEVSKECAKEMAYGLAKISNSDICISLTGIAGPDGATKENKVGTVYFGLKIKNEYYPYHIIFRGSRNQVRLRASKFILFELYRLLQKNNNI
ncbi:MAG: nicotinamide-nucleotide amidohydrolase family protein [Bacilli bacterium]|jgi:nicotinamide-nucleotide amidase|nr:nicotinamide-nucleotide amidohydrolase family protein [Bacilli bacterium]